MRAHHASKSWRHFVLTFLLLSGSVSWLITTLGQHAVAAPPLPSQLTDEEFWKLSTSLSEDDGTFRSDNLLSNELSFQYVIPDLLKATQPGRIYMGVGPEQNFTYIAALKPAMAFIVDIRHGNLDVHLLYKALFELSSNRAEFVSRLFSLKQPAGLTAQSSANTLFTAYGRAYRTSGPDQELYKANLKAVIDHLKTKHKFPLSEGDVDGIAWAYSNYSRFGPEIYYNSSTNDFAVPPRIVGVEQDRRGGGRGFNGTTYADLMMADDGMGKERSYLASEENFTVLKNLETKNLLVPVVGDFGGPKAIREVGKYVKSVNGMVAAFYLSNVEQYLAQAAGKTEAFLSSVAALPIDQSSRFIRSSGFGGGGRGALGSELGNMYEESKAYAGR